MLANNAALTSYRDVAVEPGLLYAQDDIWGKIRPNHDINDEAMACGRRAFASAGKTETADIEAGSEVGFHISKQIEGHSVSSTPDITEVYGFATTG